MQTKTSTMVYVTGWVCVNVGTVDNVIEETAIDARSDLQGFVGFGKTG